MSKQRGVKAPGTPLSKALETFRALKALFLINLYLERGSHRDGGLGGSLARFTNRKNRRSQITHITILFSRITNPKYSKYPHSYLILPIVCFCFFFLLTLLNSTLSSYTETNSNQIKMSVKQTLLDFNVTLPAPLDEKMMTYLKTKVTEELQKMFGTEDSISQPRPNTMLLFFDKSET